MPSVRIRDNESFEVALRRFKRTCEKAGVLTDVRKHEYFEKPSQERKRKRALIVIISNLRDEDDDTLLPAMRLLQKRHLVLFASLRERALDEAVELSVRNFDDALTHAAAIDYRQRRDAAFRRLQHGSVVCLDVPPRKLAVALVNQYLEVKRSGRL